MFQLFTPGLFTLSSVRGALPRVKDAGCENTEVLNQWDNVWSLIAGFVPVQSGRSLYPRRPVGLLVAAPKTTGVPSLKVARVTNCHPPITRLTMLLASVKSALPRP